MKIMVAVLVVASLAAAQSQTDESVRTCAKMDQYRRLNMARFEPHYLVSLRHNLDAVTESALREVALIKLAQPGLEIPGVYDQICDLSEGGRSVAIRYKASLVRQVFDSPEMFVAEGWREYRTDEDVFTAISDRLQKSVLAIVIR
jgi:hypothetical protein